MTTNRRGFFGVLAGVLEGVAWPRALEATANPMGGAVLTTPPMNATILANEAILKEALRILGDEFPGVPRFDVFTLLDKTSSDGRYHVTPDDFHQFGVHFNVPIDGFRHLSLEQFSERYLQPGMKKLAHAVMNEFRGCWGIATLPMPNPEWPEGLGAQWNGLDLRVVRLYNIRNDWWTFGFGMQAKGISGEQPCQ